MCSQNSGGRWAGLGATTKIPLCRDLNPEGGRGAQGKKGALKERKLRQTVLDKRESSVVRAGGAGPRRRNSAGCGPAVPVRAVAKAQEVTLLRQYTLARPAMPLS